MGLGKQAKTLSKGQVDAVLGYLGKPNGNEAKDVSAARSSPRKEGNLLGVIYARAWKHHRLGDLTNSAVATNIEKVIVRLAELTPNFKIAAKSQRITQWLDDARQRFGEPPKKDA